MGFSWTFYFCQRAVEAVLERRGFANEGLARDRQAAVPLQAQDMFGAAYVDGAAVGIGDRQEVLKRAQ
eukprot:10252813-Lingulodinium_polyedra.AAC.1